MKKGNDSIPEEINGKKLTSEFHLEGVGVVYEYGELDLERLVKLLLECKAITG